MSDRRLPHGYTNESWIEDARVVKHYSGIDGDERLRTEVAATARAAGAVPVPDIVEVDALRRHVVLGLLPGRHGQELIDEGYATQVLAAAGRTLRRLQDERPGLVHGDYGPQNLLLDTATWEVSAVLDWEFAHDGDPVEDLAWAEWIVRMHHPGAAGAVPSLFHGHGTSPAWPVRQAVMVQRCLELERLCEHRGQDGAAARWRTRTAVTRSWRA